MHRYIRTRRAHFPRIYVCINARVTDIHSHTPTLLLCICSAIISAVDSLNVNAHLYTLSSRSCTPQTRSCPSRLTAIIANRRYRCTSSGTVRKSSSRVKASRSHAQGRTLRLFGTDLMRDAIIRRRSPRVILLSYPLYHNTIRISLMGVSADRCYSRLHCLLKML